MSTLQTGVARTRKPLRLWPGVITALVIVLLRFVVPPIAPALTVYGVIAGVVGGLMIVLWWLFFSRAPWPERLGAIATMIVAGAASAFVVHRSIATGMMGNMLPVYALPITVGPAFVVWAVATRHLSRRIRLTTMVATILLASMVWTLFRTDGVTGEGVAQLTWRWTPTAEERLAETGPLLPQVTPAPKEATAAPSEVASDETAPPKAAEAPKPSEAAAEAAPAITVPNSERTAEPVAPTVAWTGFRGPSRDAVVRGVPIETDWSASPPVELWRRPIGPGWSSFAVAGDLFYTQEQRGDNELVACYRLSTGEPVWVHRDAARFYESNGGPGPRGTPTVHSGRVYAMGATGILNALNARTGAVIWSRNAAADTGAPPPGWGFAGSPLVVENEVIVAASGRLAAYGADTGELRWTRRTQGAGYSSPHLATIDGVPQVVLLSGGGATGVALSDGAVLWEHTWEPGTSIVQPAVLSDGELVFSGADMMGAVGIRRIAVVRQPSGWTVEERWTSRGLKPYFNDFVVHEGHAYGFDGSILAAIDLKDGERKWKGGRYGHGQMILLPDQDALLVLSEEGELALVSATPDKFTELARFKAIEGKTWNHPVLVGDVVLVRNGEEMAAFRLPRAAQ